MSTCYVIGHKNPDTDSVASAIAYAELKIKLGEEAIPLVASQINKGTALALQKFGVEKPQLADFSKIPEECVILVDHNEEGQWATGLVKEHVCELIDHHRMGDFSSAKPIFVRVEPVGSTSTIISCMYQEKKHVPERHIAGLLLSAILTDTLMFKSPTTTVTDQKMAEWLNEIVQLDMMEHAKEIFKAKSDISDMSLDDVVRKDFKEYHFNNKIKVGFSVFETVDFTDLVSKKAELLKVLSEIKTAKKLDFLFFAVVDIINQASYFISTENAEKQLLEKVYGQSEKNGLIELKGIVSRKKQMIPPLEEYFAKK